MKELFGFYGDGDLDLAATYAGRPAVQFEVRSGFGATGTPMRHLMVIREGMRYGVTINVAYMVEHGDGQEKMEELVEWIEEGVLIDLPE